MVDLRLLGAAPRIPLEPLRRLFPIMWTGFWVNAISGVLLFATDATTKGTTTVLYRAIAIISIVSWFFVIYWGRMLPFLGNAF